MSVRVKRRSRLIVALLAFVSFVLTGCKIDGTIEFQADGRTRIDLTFEDSRDSMAKINQTCEGVRLTFEAELTFIKNPRVEDVTRPGGHLTCRLTSNEPFGGHVKFNKEGDTYSFEYPGAHDNDQDDYSDFPTKITIVMPAKVIRVNRGIIKGNKVIINSLDFLTYGVSIVTKKDARETQGTISQEKSRKKESSPSAGGFPVWGWAAIGGVLVVIAGCAFVMGRRRGAAKAAVGNRRQDGMAAVDGGVPPSGGEASPYQRAFGDGPEQDSHGRFRP